MEDQATTEREYFQARSLLLAPDAKLGRRGDGFFIFRPLAAGIMSIGGNTTLDVMAVGEEVVQRLLTEGTVREEDIEELDDAQ